MQNLINLLKVNLLRLLKIGLRLENHIDTAVTKLLLLILTDETLSSLFGRLLSRSFMGKLVNRNSFWLRCHTASGPLLQIRFDTLVKVALTWRLNYRVPHWRVTLSTATSLAEVVHDTPILSLMFLLLGLELSIELFAFFSVFLAVCWLRDHRLDFTERVIT